MASEPRRARIVVVDDDRFHRELARGALEPLADVEVCSNAREALAALEREPAELVLSDLEMPGPSGLRLLQQVRREHPGTELVLLTGHASVESAVEALRMGAADYLRKPIDPDELVLVVQRTLERSRLLRENVRLRDVLGTIEACRALTPCLDPGEIYPTALDLVLRSISRARGLALFHRAIPSRADGVVFRGFSEAEETTLRRVLVERKRVDLDAIVETGLL
jgi:two-component system, cell cycle response regulator